MCRKAFSSRSTNCLCRSTRTICHMWQTSDLKRSSHEDEADICQVLLRGGLQHLSSPFQLPTNLLQSKVTGQKLLRINSQSSISPVGQYPSEKICELKSCCCNWRPSRKSHDLTVLSSPPVHNFVPSGLMSMHEAPSVCPWNWRTSV